MQRLGWFVLGVISAAVVAFAAMSMFVLGSNGFSANQKPSAAESWFARQSPLRRGSAPMRELAPIRWRIRRKSKPKRARIGPITAPCATLTTAAARRPWDRTTYPPAPDMRLRRDAAA